MSRTRRLGICMAGMACLASQGCARSGAPTLALFGSYFPAWLFCAVIGVIGAILARVAVAAIGRTAPLALEPFAYVALGVLIGVLVWLIFYGR